MFFGASGKPSIFGMVTLVMRCPNYATGEHAPLQSYSLRGTLAHDIATTHSRGSFCDALQFDKHGFCQAFFLGDEGMD